MTVLEWFETIIGSTDDPVLQIFGIATGLIIASGFFNALFGSVFTIFSSRR